MTLEELLNKLIEKGWKPFGKEYDHIFMRWAWKLCFRWKFKNSTGDNAYDYYYDDYCFRKIFSKESLLWQFVCENGMVIEKENEIKMWDDIHSYDYISVEYRLIECALCDEDKLEQFLLDKIKIWNEN